MEFSVLGPLEVRCDGRPVPVPGRHAPRLLALLLLESGRTVTIARLIETLWDDDPPATARRQVQNTMAALRRALPDSRVIAIDGNGYRLDPEGHDIDLSRFQRRRDAARDAEPREALALLREALALWRGEALAGLGGAVLAAAAARLAEDRLAAVEARIELELGLGRHRETVAELQELITDHPHRMRLVESLMRALQLSGRSPEAVQVYQRLRERLAAELGIDPDQRLQRLHTAILRAEDSPEAPVDRPADTVPVPAQLPAAPSTFTGRRDHIAELDGLLTRGGGTAVVSAIAGMGGAGKTALALHWGHRVRERFPGGQLYINLRGYDSAEPVAPIDALGRFLVALGRPSNAIPSDVDEAAAQYRSLLSRRRMLVVLDNARSAQQVRPLLPGGAGNVALVTSRDRLASLTTLNDAHPVRLDTLTSEESLDLIAAGIGRERINTDIEAAQRISHMCGRLPLALRIAAANLLAQPELDLADFADTLAGPDRLARLNADGDPRASVSRAIELSVLAINGPARELFHRLGTVPGADFGHDLAVHLSESREPAATASLTELEAAHLLDRYRGDRYRFHDLVRDYAAGTPGPSTTAEWRERLRARHIEWHYDMAETLPPEEASNVISALRAWEDHSDSWKLAAILYMFTDNADNLTELLQRTQNALTHAAARADTEGLARTHYSLAHIYDSIGDFDASLHHSRQALEHLERTPRGDADGDYRHYLGLRLADIGNPDEAATHLHGAFEAALRNGHTGNIVKFAGSNGSIYRQRGSYAEAERYFLIGLEHTDPDRIDFPRVTVTGELAMLYRDMGRYDEALSAVDVGVAWARDTGNSRIAILAATLRSEILTFMGRIPQARAELESAQANADRTGRGLFAYDVQLKFIEMAIAEADLADAQRRLESLEDARQIANNATARAGLARVRCDYHNGLAEYRTAIEHGHRAAELYASIPWPLRQARVLLSLATAYEGTGDHSAAEAHRRDALAIFTRIGVPEADEVRALLAG